MTELPPDPAPASDERTMLVEFLDYYRAVFTRKVEGLDADQMRVASPPSDLTLGGLLNHLALVEDNWFTRTLLGRDEPEPWASAPWDDDVDWELHSAATTEPAELWRRYHDAIERSRAITAEATLDQLAVHARRNGDVVTLRWILIHMIEEYARHCGHADFIRQAVDGQTGD